MSRRERDLARARIEQSKQSLEDPAVHRWYRIPQAFPDHFVAQTCDRFAVSDEDYILDPFCGTGTTLVECKKLGIRTLGIEANPALALISKVKTTWTLNPGNLVSMAREAVASAAPALEELECDDDGDYQSPRAATRRIDQLRESSDAARYIIGAGMLNRRWISEAPLFKGLALQEAIDRLTTRHEYHSALQVALAVAVAQGGSNLSYGPELYVNRVVHDANIGELFLNQVAVMAEDLRNIRPDRRDVPVTVLTGDARHCEDLIQPTGIRQVTHVITSPPYPNEKDYTRTTRLELIFLGFVYSTSDLRSIKKQMLRSHTKGIYHDDCDGKLVEDLASVRRLRRTLRAKVANKKHGFARLYPRVIEEYFGGMYRHLQSLAKVLTSGGKCAYVVGDQRTYLGMHVPTAEILAEIAALPAIGLSVDGIDPWRLRMGTTGNAAIPERILYLKRP